MLKLIPDWIIYVAFATLLALLGVQTLHVSILKEGIAKTSLAAATAVTAGLQLKITTDDQTRLKNEESDRVHQAELDRLRGDLDSIPSGRVSDSPELTTVVVQARKTCPTSPSAPKPAGDPIGVLADVLSRTERREEVYARTADERGAAGRDCERRYDNLPE